MKYILILSLLLNLLSTIGHTQPIFVLDKKAIAKSGENIAVNLAKNQKYQKVRDFTHGLHENYFSLETLQQQLLDDLKSAETAQDLHWTDLTKSIYLATEIIKGSSQPGIEIEYVIEHPILQRSLEDSYRELFIVGSNDVLPSDLASWQQAKNTSESVAKSFYLLAAGRKAYGAVAYQYLSEDLILKATEMSELLKQPAKFSMKEAERLRLQSYAEDYLQLAGRLVARSDQLLLEVAQTQPLQEAAAKTHRRLTRAALGQTLLFNF